MVEFRRTNAIRLWFGVLSIVLLALYLQCRHYEERDFNFLVHGNEDAAGAKVVVDGKERGVLSSSNQFDVPGSHFRDRLPAGEHLVEINKPGFVSFKKSIKMGLEGFVGVTLVPIGKQTDTSAKE
jgi:hypothetical protein